MSLTFVNKTGHITSYSNLGRLLILLGILILGLVVAGFLVGPGYLLYAYYRVAHGPMTLKDTAHLDLYYLSGPTSERKVEALASDLERSYQALHRILGREPESRPTLFLLPETGISRPYPLLALATLREDEDDLGAGTRALATLFLRRPARGNDCLREGAAAYLQGRIRAHRGGFPSSARSCTAILWDSSGEVTISRCAPCSTNPSPRRGREGACSSFRSAVPSPAS